MLQLDIQNAFNSVPHEVIIDQLTKQGVTAQFINYLEIFLKARHAELIEVVECGVPQGDPLSMLLFCIATNPILDAITSEKLDFVAYADDVVVDIKTEPWQEDDKLKWLSRKYKEIGLTLNVEKSHSTCEKGEVEFMG